MVILGPVPAQMVAGHGGGGPKSGQMNSNKGCRAREKTGGERERERIKFIKNKKTLIYLRLYH